MDTNQIPTTFHLKIWIKNNLNKTNIKGALLSTLFLFHLILANAQNVGSSSSKNKQFQITIGASTGISKYSFTNDFNDSSLFRNVFLESPPLHVYGEWVNKRAIIGVAAGFESIVTTINDSTSLRVKGRQTTTYIFTGIRASYIILKRKKNSLYLGSRINYIHSNNKNIPSNAPLVVRPNRFGMQLYMGNRYFFSDRAGFTFELALGRPFLALAGFSFIVD